MVYMMITNTSSPRNNPAAMLPASIASSASASATNATRRSMLMLSLPAATVVGAMLILWLARWMQATVDNPGGFGKEFRALALDRRVAYVAVALAVLAVFAGRFAGGLFGGLTVLVIIMYAIQGIALLHAGVAKRGASVAWLVAVYLGIIIIPLAAILGLGLAGFSDTWFDYRRRWGVSE